MITYYSYATYARYGIAVSLVAALCLAAWETAERRSRAPLRIGIGALLTASALYPLSSTCPYPWWAAAFRAAAAVGAACGALALAATAIRAAARAAAGGPTGATLPTERMARWILDALRDDVIVMDSRYDIVSWGELDFGGHGPFLGDSLDDLLARLDAAGYAPELRDALARVGRGEYPEGELALGGRRYRYWRSAASPRGAPGDGAPGACVFYLCDVTDEYALLEALESQNTRLLNRNRRLVDEAALARSLESEAGLLREREAVTERVREYLRRVKARLGSLEGPGEPTESSLEAAVVESREAMDRIRETVHGMRYRRRND